MLDFQAVDKAYGTQVVLESVSFTVHAGEHVGIIGPNGTGKTTLFELITGTLTADRGTVNVPRGARIGHVRQQLRVDDPGVCLRDYVADALSELRELHGAMQRLEANVAQLEGRERAAALTRLGELQTEFEHKGGYRMRQRAEATLSGLGFPQQSLSAPFRVLSGGWQMRAELARTLVAEPDILLLDEPTNYLDSVAVEWLQMFLRDFAGTMLLISHDRYLLEAMTRVTFEVANGSVTRYTGNYREYVQARRLRQRQLQAAQRNQQRRRDQIERFVERFRAKSSKASQVQSRLRMLDRMEAVAAPPENLKPARLILPPPPRCGIEVVRLEDAGVCYGGSPWVLRHVELRLERGDKTAVVGFNGAGKTTLLRLLAGSLAPGAGSVLFGHRVKVGYQAQDFAEVLEADRTVLATARAAGSEATDGDVRAVLGAFGFSGAAVDKRVDVLSGGEKVRLALIRLLLSPCNFLVLDEPTTHLDIPAREALETALRAYTGTLCLVSHDVAFLRQVATSVVALDQQGLTRYHGGYDYYRERTDAAQTREVASPDAETPPPPVASDRKVARRARAERRQELAVRQQPLQQALAAAESRLEELASEQADLVRELTAAGVPDHERISRRLGALQAETERETAAWEQAGLELERLADEVAAE